MSKQLPRRALSPRAVRARKGGEPIVCLTAYTTPMARLVDAHADVILVGDSLAMTIYGMDSTVGVTLDMMIAHGAAVARGTSKACLVVDLPFGSYEASPEQAFHSAARVLAETGAAAIKLEGGQAMAPTVAFLTARGVPVMGHVGLTPQAVNQLGGFKVQGRDPADHARILEDAIAIAEAGAFAIVIEKVTEPLGAEITRRVAVPTIGIGASAECDGQILVVDDMLGLFPDFRPRFVKVYAELGDAAASAIERYADDVRQRRFPAAEHCFAPSAPAVPIGTPDQQQRSKA